MLNNGTKKLQTMKRELEKVRLRKWAENPTNHPCPTCGLFNHWQPIETAPKGKELLLYDRGEISSGAFVYIDNNGFPVFTWGWLSYRCPSHWTHLLPEPPE